MSVGARMGGCIVTFTYLALAAFTSDLVAAATAASRLIGARKHGV
jgi:hypothetical protein